MVILKKCRRNREGETIPCSRENRQRGGHRQKMNLVNQPAVPFELQGACGKTFRLADYNGFWLFMVFLRHLG